MEIKNKQDNDDRAAIEAEAKQYGEERSRFCSRESEKNARKSECSEHFKRGMEVGINYVTQKLADAAGQSFTIGQALEVRAAADKENPELHPSLKYIFAGFKEAERRTAAAYEAKLNLLRQSKEPASRATIRELTEERDELAAKVKELEARIANGEANYTADISNVCRAVDLIKKERDEAFKVLENQKERFSVLLKVGSARGFSSLIEMAGLAIKEIDAVIKANNE